MTAEAHERAARLAELRETREPAAADLARDVAAIQSVILEALRRDADELGAEPLADLAERIAEAVAARAGGGRGDAGQPPLARARVARQQRPAHRPARTCATCTPSSSTRWPSPSATSIPSALLMLDVDGLKRVNDAQGHAAGDRVLVQVALAVRRSIRTVDTPARIGGDEFCVLAPRPDRGGGQRAGASAWPRRSTAETAGAAGEEGVGISIGVVSCPEHGDDADSLLESADQAMYRAKAGGERGRGRRARRSPR